MDCIHEVCIICDQRLQDNDESDFHWTSTLIEDDLRDLRVFMCKILSVPASYFEYSGFPFCKDCTNTRIKNLLQIQNELIALRISYTTLKEKLLKDIVTVYFSRNLKSNQFSPVETRLKEKIIQKWQDYSVDFPILKLNDWGRNNSESIHCSPDRLSEEFDGNLLCDEVEIKNELSEMEEQFSPEMSPRQLSKDEYLSNDPLDDNIAKNSFSGRRKRSCRKEKVNYCDDLTISFNNSKSKENDDNYSEPTRFKNNVSKRKSDKNKKRKEKIPKIAQEKYRGTKKNFQCPHCPKIFGDTGKMEEHIRIHTGERPYKCSDCNKAFRQSIHLSTHQKLIHGYQGKTKTSEGLNEIASKNRHYNCSLCCSQSKSKGHFFRHLIQTHMNREIQEGESLWFYYCDVKDCLISCNNKNDLQKHFNESHKDLLGPGYSEFPQCEVCKRLFAMQENLDIHKSCHFSDDNENESFFGCQYCHEIFKNENELSEHVPRHKLTCDISQIFCHMCDLCERTYKDLSTLLAHKRKSHKNKSNKIKKPKAPASCSNRYKVVNHFTNYECWLCLIWYTKRGNFLRHLKSVHMDKEVKYGDSFWFYNCDVKECFAACVNADNLLKHFQASHADLSQDGRFPQCYYCQRVFALQQNLELHQSCHSKVGDELKFSCEYCPDLFLSASERNEHQSEHKILFDLSEFSHKCDICNEGFKSYSNLYQHKRVVHKPNTNVTCIRQRPTNVTSIRQRPIKHTERNSLQCSVCPFKASTPTNIRLHTEKIHPQVETSVKLLRNGCQFCEKRFYLKTELHKHSIRYHRSEYLMRKSFCISCFNTFDTEEEMKTHFKEKHAYLICSVETCGKLFPSKKNLWLHMNVHKKEKPFICEYCSEGFAQEASLQYHVNRKHTFHRSFFCKLCPDNPGYYERVAFKKHVEKEHPTCAVKEILITKYPKREYFF